MSHSTKQLRDELLSARKADHEAQRAELAKWRENGQHPWSRPYPWRPHERTTVVEGVRVPAEPLINWLKTFKGDPELAITRTTFRDEFALCFKISKATLTLIRVFKLSDHLSSEAVITLKAVRYTNANMPYPISNDVVRRELIDAGYCELHRSGGIWATYRGKNALEQDAWQ